MSQKTIRAYRSCFIIDVQISNDVSQLIDSAKNRYFVDMKDKDAVNSFLSWFKDLFLKSKSQLVTIFEYEIKYDDDIQDTYIKKFYIE